jgi:hypothetical protein
MITRLMGVRIVFMQDLLWRSTFGLKFIVKERLAWAGKFFNALTLPCRYFVCPPTSASQIKRLGSWILSDPPGIGGAKGTVLCSSSAN